MIYDITRPWLTLDPWQKEYAFETKPDKPCFLLSARQCGKTTAMSIKSVELCVKHFKRGEFILICSITEKQAYHMLAKALAYAREKYPEAIGKGRDIPTMHKLLFPKHGTGILCYAAGETGEGLRGYTIKKLMIDEGSRMSEEFYIAVEPMLSVIEGSMDIASTPAGKKHKDGSLKYFYKCSLDKKFKKFYISAEDCPRHDPLFLKEQKKRLSRLAYAQEYQAIFTDELKRLFDDELIKDTCVLKRIEQISRNRKYYMGVDVAGLGEDECTFEVLELMNDKTIQQRAHYTKTKKLTTQTSKEVINIDQQYKCRQIGVDDGGLGFGVFSELLDSEKTKRKVVALNNASRPVDKDGVKSKRLLKEEMYINLLVLMENHKIKLLDDDEIKLSLASIQHEGEKLFGSYSHITEGIIRAAWLAEKGKGLNIFMRSF